MKVLIVSGFLGAGKTTFIRQLTDKVPGRQFAVFENEFGQTDIDAKLIGQKDSQMKVWEMTENCVCCTGKSDFLSSLMTISSAVDPEILIVEPTGIAKLGNLIANIEGMGYDRIRMLKSVVIVDIHSFMDEKDRFDDIYLNQIQNAATIVFSKSEQMSEEETAPYVQEVRKLNPTAEIVTGDYRKREASWWESLLENLYVRPGDEKEAAASKDASSAHPEGGVEVGAKLEAPMQTVTFNNMSLPTPVHLMMILDLITGDLFGKIVRAKGYLPCGTPNEWIRFDLVDHQWAITGFAPQEESVVTFIGPEIHEKDLREYFTILKQPKIRLKFGAKREA